MAAASTAGFPVGALDGPVAVAGSTLAGADEEDLAVGGVAAEATGVPPRLLT
jgi:hypothetical protein